jgi:hypothetical protein
MFTAWFGLHIERAMLQWSLLRRRLRLRESGSGMARESHLSLKD